jgi:hypothetical protein
MEALGAIAVENADCHLTSELPTSYQLAVVLTVISTSETRFVCQPSIASWPLAGTLLCGLRIWEKICSIWRLNVNEPATFL